MNVEPIIFFDMLLAILILSITLGTVVFYFSRIVKKLQQDTQDLSGTRQKALKMIDDANSKAMDIINKANLFSNSVTGDFNDQIKRVSALQIKEFEKNSSDFIKSYLNTLQELKSKNIEVFQNISKDIELNTMREIKNFRESIENLTVSSENLVKKKIDSDYKAVKTELEDYKQQALKKVDDEIYSILGKVAKLALGKAMNLAEHEELIQKSLEKAKKEGVFE